MKVEFEVKEPEDLILLFTKFCEYRRMYTRIRVEEIYNNRLMHSIPNEILINELRKRLLLRELGEKYL